MQFIVEYVRALSIAAITAAINGGITGRVIGVAFRAAAVEAFRALRVQRAFCCRRATRSGLAI
jgi:hypothetical protein